MPPAHFRSGLTLKWVFQVVGSTGMRAGPRTPFIIGRHDEAFRPGRTALRSDGFVKDRAVVVR